MNELVFVLLQFVADGFDFGCVEFAVGVVAGVHLLLGEISAALGLTGDAGDELLVFFLDEVLVPFDLIIFFPDFYLIILYFFPGLIKFLLHFIQTPHQFFLLPLQRHYSLAQSLTITGFARTARIGPYLYLRLFLDQHSEG